MIFLSNMGMKVCPVSCAVYFFSILFSLISLVQVPYCCRLVLILIIFFNVFTVWLINQAKGVCFISMHAMEIQITYFKGLCQLCICWKFHQNRLMQKRQASKDKDRKKVFTSIHSFHDFHHLSPFVAHSSTYICNWRKFSKCVV